MLTVGMLTTCLGLSLAGYGAEAASQPLPVGVPVPVSVYYESYCADSIKLITQQVYPIMQMANFSLNIDLKLVPFGKASYTVADGKYTFTCQHGEKECIGNRVQSCALKHISSKKEQLEFINCVMKEIEGDSSQTYPTQKCGQSIPNIDLVDTCANGPEGNQLLAANGDITNALNPSLKSVPAVSVHNAERVDSDINLKALLCQQLSSLNLTECANTSGSSKLSSEFLAFLTTALLLILSRA